MDKLFRLTGFLPFILVVFLNAFVDLGHKILIQNTVFKVYDGQTQIVLTALVNGLILLPFLMFFTPAGYLSDRYRKPRIMRLSAAAAVGLTLLITLFYYLGWFWAAFSMTFLLAVQSAFYSPAKYGFIKALSGKERLATANALVQAITIVAILLGIFVFSLFFEQALQGISYTDKTELLRTIAPIGWILVACALAEWRFTRQLPDPASPSPQTRFDWQAYRRGRYLQHNLRKILANRTIWLSIVGLSVFWG
ncbi:MAG: acyl-[ACP]--phospholipid O-acyltransferase, partial [Chromatiales bacterium]